MILPRMRGRRLALSEVPGLSAKECIWRDRKAALRFLRKAMEQYGHPEVIVTDRLRSYRAAMCEIGNEARQKAGCWLNNRAENAHQPLRRREPAMAKFRSSKSLRKFASIHASVHNHFNQECHLVSRQTFKLNRASALTEWRQLASLRAAISWPS